MNRAEDITYENETKGSSDLEFIIDKQKDEILQLKKDKDSLQRKLNGLNSQISSIQNSKDKAIQDKNNIEKENYLLRTGMNNQLDCSSSSSIPEKASAAPTSARSLRRFDIASGDGIPGA